MNYTLRFALYLVVFSSSWLMGEKLLGYHNTIVDWLPFTSLLWLLLVGAAYVIFLRQERRNAPKWRFFDGFKASLRLSVLWLSIFLVVKALYYQFINPDYFNDLILRGREWLTMSATSDENFENATRMMEDFMQLLPYLAVTTLLQFVFCVVYGLLFSAFLKNK